MRRDTPGFARSAALLASVAVLLRVACLVALPRAATSNDLGAWSRVTEALAHGQNPYTTGIIAWPPLWMLFLAGLDFISRHTSIEFTYVLRSFLIAVDALNIVLTFRIAVRFVGLRPATYALLVGMVLNPIELFLVCQHGNFDVLVVTTLLLFTLALLAYAQSNDAVDWLVAAVTLGLGIGLKTFPLLLAPVLAFKSTALSRRARVFGTALVVGPAALGLSIVYVLTPEAVMRYVIRYRSYSGWFGLTGILEIAHLPRVSAVYTAVFPLILIVALFAIARWLRTADVSAEHIVLLIATMLAALIAFGPGYGAQYITWPLPFFTITYAAFDRVWRRDLLVALIVAVATYVFEYGLTADMGQLFVVLTHSPALQRISDLMNDDELKTIIRLPLFATYAWLVFAGAKRLRHAPSALPSLQAQSMQQTPQ